MPSGSDKQWTFLKNVAALIHWAERRGYKLTGGDLYRDSRCEYGSKSSLHRQRLAIDLNLFVNGEYQETGDYHWEMGKVWESWPNCKWGGRFQDSNHYEWSDAEWQDEPLGAREEYV